MKLAQANSLFTEWIEECWIETTHGETRLINNNEIYEHSLISSIEIKRLVNALNSFTKNGRKY